MGNKKVFAFPHSAASDHRMVPIFTRAALQARGKTAPWVKSESNSCLFGKTGPVSPSTDQSESNAKHYKIKAWESLGN